MLGITLPKIRSGSQDTDPGDRLPFEPTDLQDHYEALLLQQPLVWEHDQQLKPGHIVAIVESPYPADHGDWMALWYSGIDFALDYIPVEVAWELVVWS